MSKIILFLIIGIDAFILFFQTTQLSISYSEANILYGHNSFLQLLVKYSIQLFGNNNFGLHFIMIICHLLSVLLIYAISKKYVTQERNRLWLILTFVLLPGVISSALVLNTAGIIIFGLLLFVYLFDKIPQVWLNIVLFIYSFTDHGFAYLFLALSVYYFSQKKYMQMLYLLFLYALNSYAYGFYIYGLPR